jgi:hypothetical protein
MGGGGRRCEGRWPIIEFPLRGRGPRMTRALSLTTREGEPGAGGRVDAEPPRMMQAAFSRPQEPAEPRPGLRPQANTLDSTGATIRAA